MKKAEARKFKDLSINPVPEVIGDKQLKLLINFGFIDMLALRNYAIKHDFEARREAQEAKGIYHRATIYEELGKVYNLTPQAIRKITYGNISHRRSIY